MCIPDTSLTLTHTHKHTQTNTHTHTHVILVITKLFEINYSVEVFIAKCFGTFMFSSFQNVNAMSRI